MLSLIFCNSNVSLRKAFRNTVRNTHPKHAKMKILNELYVSLGNLEAHIGYL